MTQVTAYVAQYQEAQDAYLDYETLKALDKKDLTVDHGTGNYDVALVTKDEKGKIHIKKKEKMTKNGVEIGLLAGVLVGLVVPPVLLVEAAGGAVAGGLIGHWHKGMERKDAEDLGNAIAAGEGGIILVDLDGMKTEAINEIFTRAQSRTTHAFDTESRSIVDEEPIEEEVLVEEETVTV